MPNYLSSTDWILKGIPYPPSDPRYLEYIKDRSIPASSRYRPELFEPVDQPEASNPGDLLILEGEVIEPPTLPAAAPRAELPPGRQHALPEPPNGLYLPPAPISGKVHPGFLISELKKLLRGRGVYLNSEVAQEIKGLPYPDTETLRCLYILKSKGVLDGFNISTGQLTLTVTPARLPPHD